MNIIITNYTFNAAAATVTLGDYAAIAQERISKIYNLTQSQLLYDGTAGYNGSIATNVLTLDYNTAERMANTDKLLIVYDDAQAGMGYPPGATPLAVSSGNKAAAVAAATLSSAAGKTAYITGFTVSGSGATGGLPVIVTVTGILGGTLSYIYTAAVGVLLPNQPLSVQFPVPVPASAAGVDIVVSCPSLGTGSTNNAVSATGFRV